MAIAHEGWNRSPESLGFVGDTSIYTPQNFKFCHGPESTLKPKSIQQQEVIRVLFQFAVVVDKARFLLGQNP